MFMPGRLKLGARMKAYAIAAQKKMMNMSMIALSTLLSFVPLFDDLYVMSFFSVLFISPFAMPVFKSTVTENTYL